MTSPFHQVADWPQESKSGSHQHLLTHQVTSGVKDCISRYFPDDVPGKSRGHFWFNASKTHCLPTKLYLVLGNGIAILHPGAHNRIQEPPPPSSPTPWQPLIISRYLWTLLRRVSVIYCLTITFESKQGPRQFLNDWPGTTGKYQDIWSLYITRSMDNE